jgi:hypothetical protein
LIWVGWEMSIVVALGKAANCVTRVKLQSL